ncbi:protein of unknown function DUF1212 [Alkaliphilus metalliredigens QYMF]|uniref:Threonine/serine exporter-like N-terminal domain-containing protein n=1 Tax=Alkaliphilus metalliredigens (strain QYMF) TaxID=293826 RepID=A6TQQ0_ALKMQ|nr:threonine/serine exporter family protein [Alkaliphilus metalliredigens]ABR48518.1 protein of unknown function DUF1212 [Alkaliphilus metalliredigens QYMF]
MVSRKKIVVLALFAGEIMLKSGAETYRVEDTINRICKSRGFHYVECFVTPTGIFVSVDSKGEDQGEIISYIKRIKSRSINLNKISEVNDFSRRFVGSEIPIEEGMKQLRLIDKIKPYPPYLRSIAGGIASLFVVLLFGGNFLESLAAFFTSICITYTLYFFIDCGFTPFLTHISGGVVASLLAIVFSYTHPSINVDNVVIGALMIMVPGVAITNAVRDSIAGDLLSGLARAAEALIIATSIAFGVGFTLKLWMIMMGGTLV